MASDRPNILLFFTDQQRFDTIHALGNPVIKTPNLDRLADSGVAFTSTYSPNPVCVPARCCMHYGQYSWNTKCYDNGFAMPEDRPSFMQRLTESGYRTHGIGKCHFTPDPHALRGFESRERQEEIVADPGEDEYMKFLRDKGVTHLTDPHGVRGEMYYVPQPAQLPADLHPTQWVGDRACAFLEEQQASAQPWHLFCSFIHPHPPFAPPAPWHKLYRAPMMPLPKVPQDAEHLHTHINQRQNRYKYRDQGIDNNLMRNIKAYYYGCISFIDFQVGRVLDMLEKTGQIDNTLILFTADHGEHLGDYNCFGKRSMHDTCMRIPLIARLPGRFEGGARCNRLASLVDIAPTVLNAAGVEHGELASDGLDLADVASGAADRTHVFAQYGEQSWGLFSAISDEWKFTYSAADNREFLFDRIGDPAETRNRAGLSFCREPLDAMRTTLVDALRAGGETSALDGDTLKRWPGYKVDTDPDSGLLVQDHRWADQSIPGYTKE